MGARRAREPGFGPARDDLVALLASGSFDSISENAGETLPEVWPDQQPDQRLIHANRPVTARATSARVLLSVAVDRQSGRSGQASLFEYDAEPGSTANSHRTTAVSTFHAVPASQAPGPAGGRRIDRELHGEFEVLGFLRNHHPLALWTASIAARKPSGPPRIMACDIPRNVGKRVTLIGWPVTQKEVMTSGGLIMDFVSLEDETALYETVFFPEAYARYRHLLLDQRPLVVHGLVTEDQGALSVEVQALAPV
jgi:DNA polymerase III alpha subunit